MIYRECVMTFIDTCIFNERQTRGQEYRCYYFRPRANKSPRSFNYSGRSGGSGGFHPEGNLRRTRESVILDSSKRFEVTFGLGGEPAILFRHIHTAAKRRARARARTSWRDRICRRLIVSLHLRHARRKMERRF